MDKLNAQHKIILSFVLTIFVGTILLTLPVSVNGESISIVDALFTATSATCVTGLIVYDTGTKFTFFGQLVILILIQIGGLGFMTMTTFLIVLFGKKLTIKDKLLIEESILQYPFKNTGKTLRDIVLLVFIVEFIGAGILYYKFNYIYHYKDAVWLSVFHSISAFCNAGFSLFYDSLNKFSGDITINLTIIFLIITGGLGFLVLVELKKMFMRKKWYKNKPNLSFHSKVVLTTSLVLIVIGFIFVYMFENNAAFAGKPVKEKVLLSFFQSVTPRTAGFNSITTANLSVPTILLTILFMFIGGSSGSTAGGVKTGTAFILFTYLISTLRGGRKNFIFKRKISDKLVYRCLTIILLSIIIISLALIILCYTENIKFSGAEQGNKFLNLFFEIFSAFGTVGLSLGMTPELSNIGRIIISILMFIGRLGPMIIAITLITQREPVKFNYPEENILIG